jgi:hypothetical protein
MINHHSPLAIITLLISATLVISCSNSQPQENKPSTLIEFNDSTFNIPDGFTLTETIEGDLNGDDLKDIVLIIKDTKKSAFVENNFGETVDRNRRGIMIFYALESGYQVALENRQCFASENEDGGVYTPPELYVQINSNKLYLNYSHGRYGSWKYTFRKKGQDFEMIGFDRLETKGPIIQKETSINFLTKKKLVRENVNQNIAESGEEIFEETWSTISTNSLLKLSEIIDFEELDIMASY